MFCNLFLPRLFLHRRRRPRAVHAGGAGETGGEAGGEVEGAGEDSKTKHLRYPNNSFFAQIPKLGLAPEQTSAIESEKESDAGRALLMLQRWREAEGEAATPEELLFVLERLKMGEMAADGILTVGGTLLKWQFVFIYALRGIASILALYNSVYCKSPHRFPFPIYFF